MLFLFGNFMFENEKFLYYCIFIFFVCCIIFENGECYFLKFVLFVMLFEIYKRNI